MFFITKIQKIRAKLDSAQPSSLQTHAMPTICARKLNEFHPPTCEVISKLIKSSSSASCALDPIPTKLVKTQCLDTLIHVICMLVTESLQSGEFPNDFKLAHVCPLLKKPTLERNEYKNYRPVSNLAFVSKLIEKAVVDQLNTHLLENELMEEFQSAYRKGHSTETALLRVQSDILCAIDQGKAAFLVLLDLSAAFDTIDHDRLLTFMETQLGIGGTVLKWFRSYLSNRKQCVFINGAISPASMLKYGVPQGSVLGPILFCIYMLPLSQMIKRHNMALHIYADDTQLYCFFNVKSSTDAGSALSAMMICIQDVQAWMSQSLLKLNEDKTEFLVVSSPHCQEYVKNITLRVGDVEVISCKKCRNLGVIFDSKLDMKDHVASVCRSSFFQLRKISSIRKYLSDESCATLIHSFVTSRIDYCNALLANLPKCVLAKLQKVQNVAARVLTRTRRYDDISPVLIDIHWLPLPLRIRYKVNLLTFKSLHGLGPSYLKNLLCPYSPSVNLRSASKGLLKEHSFKLVTYGHRAFYVVAPNYWNALPLELRFEQELSTFKAELKTHLFTLFITNPELYVF